MATRGAIFERVLGPRWSLFAAVFIFAISVIIIYQFLLGLADKPELHRHLQHKKTQSVPFFMKHSVPFLETEASEQKAFDSVTSECISGN